MTDNTETQPTRLLVRVRRGRTAHSCTLKSSTFGVCLRRFRIGF